MTMEASPFDRQNRPLSIILSVARQATSAELGRGEMSGGKGGSTA